MKNYSHEAIIFHFATNWWWDATCQIKELQTFSLALSLLTLLESAKTAYAACWTCLKLM